MPRTSSASTSAPSRDARSSSGRATAPSSAPPSTTTPHGVIDAALPGSGDELPPDVGAPGARGLARGAARPRCRRRSPPPASTRRDVVGIATDFTACTHGPDARRRHAALPSSTSSRDRPHAYAKLWKHHAAQEQADRINALAAAARRAVAAALRRPDLLGVGVRQGACSCSRRTRRSTPRSSAGSRPPTGSSGSSAAPSPATPAPPATRASSRTAATLDGLPRARSTPGFAGFVADKLEHPLGQLGDRAGEPHRRGGRLDRAARGHRGRGRQRRRARHRAGRAGRSSRARWSRSWARRRATS